MIELTILVISLFILSFFLKIQSFLLILVFVFILMKFDFIVFDRKVFYFQISHIVKRGKIINLREYDAMRNYVEMLFEIDNDSFADREDVEIYNNLLVNFHNKNNK